MKTISFRLLTLFLVLVLFGCNKVDEGLQTETAIAFIEIGNNALYGNGQEGITQSNMIISNPTDWQNLMSQMNTINTATANFKETEIDFDEFTVIAIFLDVKGSGWEIKIKEVVENENAIHISTLETKYATTVMTQPFHLIKIPKTEKTIVFD